MKVPKPTVPVLPQHPAHPLGKLSLDTSQVLHKPPRKSLPVCVTQLEGKTSVERLTGNIRGFVTTIPCGNFWKQREEREREKRTVLLGENGHDDLAQYKLC